MSPTRHVAIGDPQAPFESFLGILDQHRLRADARLVSLTSPFIPQLADAQLERVVPSLPRCNEV